MRIRSVRARVEHLPLSRPYTIAFRSIDSVRNVIVCIETDTAAVGLGAASPEPFVTGESDDACQSALAPGALDWLVGEDLRTLPRLCRRLREALPATPAARAAVDVALHDLWGQLLERPLVELLGRAHDSLPTSVTIGILPLEETLAEAAEHVGRGFRRLKVKLGRSLEEDLERLHRLRELHGSEIGIRVDPNQGYSLEELQRFVRETADLELELLEQPLKADAVAALRTLPDVVRRRVAADESLLSEADAVALAAAPAACGIFNIKLMKCGGIHPARAIATIAEAAGIELMWGCMDESVISIAGALHAALASPATRYLDLDGSFDLARDVATGGFVLEDGCLRTLEDAPGLGVQLA